MLPITYHAQTRLQQRGIPPFVVEKLLDYGRQMHDHRGGSVLYFDHRARKQLQRQLPRDNFRRIERHFDAYAVVGSDGSIVTVGHRTHRINRN